MNITETAKIFAAQIGPEIDAYAARAAQTPSGSRPGSVERDNTRRLRTAIAMELIGGTDERLRDLIRVEQVKPHGNYSMCAIIGADKVLNQS
jgi:hypothetical protein